MLTSTKTTVLLGEIEAKFDLSSVERNTRSRRREITWIVYNLSQDDENYDDLGAIEIKFSPSNFATEDYPETLQVTIVATNGPQEDLAGEPV